LRKGLNHSQLLEKETMAFDVGNISYGK